VRADHVLVNSDFVKRTFVEQGWEPGCVHVLYLGVDDAFLDAVVPRHERSGTGPLRLLFAGSLEHRKGSTDLESALLGLGDVEWTLDVAGPIPPASRRQHRALLADPRVRALGVLSRPRLAKVMAGADVFLFP